MRKKIEGRLEQFAFKTTQRRPLIIVNLIEV
jgi:hypothetical protein